LKWIVRLEKPLSPALSPEYRGKGEKPTIQRLHTSRQILSNLLPGQVSMSRRRRYNAID
jgi:hypothetical protein